MLFQLVSIEA